MKKKLDRNFLFFTYACKKAPDNFMDLERSINDAIHKNNFKLANDLGGRAATDYGVAGLLLHNKARIHYLRIDKAENGSVQLDAIKCLGIILACEQIIKENNEERAHLSQLKPDVNPDSVDFWKDLQDEICELGDITTDAAPVVSYKNMFLSRYALPNNILKT